ncbi:hypothetical protein THASP1DRAFT_31647 [Thamnocephalis sphaerospora]|uniref:N-acetyltransferase domain-containing protein n=1 Tax=Thamnocephalis sphaerospora TaxID=78915 RepID=A0A4P9XL30_9FUNG|nr:hypothetical protein THASP1DRAFT_31647 [Thamnocephalis sphaerospora]|eukprot:RKP06543.1 hypothetical protein THASP1DRAFT_31647 [Thamnocephalis sphaerospora]
MNTLRTLRAPPASQEAVPVQLERLDQLTVRTAVARDREAVVQLLKSESTECAALSLHRQFMHTLTPWAALVPVWAVMMELLRRWASHGRAPGVHITNLLGLTDEELHEALVSAPFTFIAAATAIMLLFMWRTFSIYEHWCTAEQTLWQLDNLSSENERPARGKKSAKEAAKNEQEPAIWVALVQGRYVGAVRASSLAHGASGGDATDGTIRLALHAHHRNDAVGARLLSTALEHAQEHKWQRVYAVVSRFYAPVAQTLTENEFRLVESEATHGDTKKLLASYPSLAAGDQSVYVH